MPIICALLGAPREDWQQFSLSAADIFTAFTLQSRRHRRIPHHAGVERTRRTTSTPWSPIGDAPTEDLLSDLIRAEEDGDGLNANELRMLAGGLLLAGTDTTRNQLAASLDVICEHPDQGALSGDRPELAANAVEETMRHSPIACGTLRIVVRGHPSWRDTFFPPARLVPVNTFAANRDTAVYDDPDRFDISRDGAPAVLVRRRHALLPRREPGAVGTRRSHENRHSTDAGAVAPVRLRGSRCWG